MFLNYFVDNFLPSIFSSFVVCSLYDYWTSRAVFSISYFSIPVTLFHLFSGRLSQLYLPIFLLIFTILFLKTQNLFFSEYLFFVVFSNDCNAFLSLSEDVMIIFKDVFIFSAWSLFFQVTFVHLSFVWSLTCIPGFLYVCSSFGLCSHLSGKLTC